MIRLCWKPLLLLDVEIPAGDLRRGEKRRLVMPRAYQFEYLRRMSSDYQDVCLQTGQEKIPAGSAHFVQHVLCMLHQRSTLANLSLRENLLLPFLYQGRGESLECASDALADVALHLGIADKLDEQAGEGSGYMHALISLGRAMLMRPDFIVVQDAYAAMQLHRQDVFRSLFCETVESLGSGILYLSTSAQEGSGLEFCQSFELIGAQESL